LPPPDRHGAAFGVYVHWPFCQAKCPYCDFNSHVRPGVDQRRYAQALVRELQTMACRMPDAQVTSIFFGGGTPSLMAPGDVALVLDAIAGLWPVAPEAEITLEANPTSVEAARFRGYRAAGVNRVSLGVQALDDAHLKALGRLHTADEALAALALARSIFTRVSFDLIYTRPGQTVAAWRDELTRALAYAAGHASLYQLTIEAGTPFAALHAAGRLAVPEQDAAAAMYAVTQEVCDQAGLAAYEISNHARPGEESRHNLVYWRGQPYVAAGPGAHGRMHAGGTWRATHAHDDPACWLAQVDSAGHGLAVDEPVDNAARAVEMVLMGLRLSEGVPVARLPVAYDAVFDDAAVHLLAAEGLLVWHAGVMAVTAKGRPVLDAIVREIVR